MAPLMRRFMWGLWPMVVLLGLLLLTLTLMSVATENSRYFGRLYFWLLGGSSAGLLILLVLISRSLFKLVRRYRARAPGARLTLRLVSLFMVIALAPLAVVYAFSLQFLQRGIDSWFDVRVEESLNDALELSRTALDLRMREVLRQTTRLAENLAGVDSNLLALSVGDLLNHSDASELTLLAQNGRILAAASADTTAVVPNRPSDAILLQVRQGRDYVNLEPIPDGGFHVRAVVLVPARHSRDETRFLQALYAVTDRFSLLADSVRAAFETYQELLFLRVPLKASFILSLTLVMLLGVLSALWAAVYAAHRLVEPIRELAAGTRAVAAGEYDKQLPHTSKDELGFLVDSFNQMTRGLALARDSAQHSQQLVERQRTYLEAVLARLSSGVLTLDHDGCLRTCNPAASQILGMDLESLIGTRGDVIGEPETPLRHLLEAIMPRIAAANDWRQDITLFTNSGRRMVMCRGSSLPDPLGLKGGHVIVFDDITALMQAERDAAWAEVARRLAHEIKNPLTPIQLSAERIRHKYLAGLDPNEARVLDRGTHTIIQQVQAMKEMVDAFNEYARPPALRLTTVSLNDFIHEVLQLYGEYPAGVEIQLDLDPRQPVIEADKLRLRQLLHNLVKNAIEAIRDGQGSMLRIATRLDHEAGAEYVELRFQDDGPGFPKDLKGNIFEPYVTTKPKGTGLGLAIVKRIVEEHGGVIRGESPATGGACIAIRFPLSALPVVTLPATMSEKKEAG